MTYACRLCGHDESAPRYDLGDARIVRCTRCGLLVLDPWPTEEETRQVYDETYFRNPDFLYGENPSLYGYADYAAERFNKQPQYARLARQIKALLPRKVERPAILEAGCGFGYFLDEAFEEGFAPEGLEFNEHAVARLRQKYAFPVHAGAIERLRFEPGRYDAIALFDVIEHLRDPFGALDRFRSMLAPCGLLVLTTPDAESVTSRLLGSRLEDFRRTREHLFFFGRDTLRRALEERGFDVLEIRSIGHTFELAFLLDRLALYQRPLFSALRRGVELLRLGKLQIPVNPLTKMIVFARRRHAPRPEGPAQQAGSDLEQRLVDELALLERHASRHYRSVFRRFESAVGSRVLEVGSGIGTISSHLLPRAETLLLTDHQELFLRHLRARFGDLPQLRYRLLDLERLPAQVEGGPFDTIVCLNVLEHVRDDESALRGLRALLAPNGRLVLQVPWGPWLFGSLDEAYGHHRRYTRSLLRRRLEAAGLRIREERRIGATSIPGWFVYGRILRRRQLDARSLRSLSALFPLTNAVDRALSRALGLSILAIAEPA
jgi:2-polyprenyl-3-methyl-5-hydroxy-6-metoxy-1,4-benzoquinol methylase